MLLWLQVCAALAKLAARELHHEAHEGHEARKRRLIRFFFSFVIFAPVVETLIMAGFISLFLRFMSPPKAILLSAFGWAIAHSMQVAGWGLVIWWPFLIFSTLFVVWRQRGWWTAVGVVTATHFLQNLGPGLAIAFG